MSISSEFKEAVAANNKLRTKIMLGNYMLLDPTFAMFDENYTYAQQRIPDLMDEHDGESLNYDVSAWNKAYLDRQLAILEGNFSKERIELLRNMCRMIYSEKVEATQRERFVKEHQAPSSAPTKKQIGIGAAIGGGVAAAVGLACSQPVITAAGAAAVVVGGVLIIADKEG